MHQIPSSAETLVVMADFGSMSPSLVFDYMTKPELLTQWWPKVVELNLVVGGNYAFSWPPEHWNLHGTYLAIEPGKRLSYTWSRDQALAAPEQTVDIYFETYRDKGTRIGIFHDGFTTGPAGEAERQGTAEGWIHFLMLLEGLSDGSAD